MPKEKALTENKSIKNKDNNVILYFFIIFKKFNFNMQYNIILII